MGYFHDGLPDHRAEAVGKLLRVSLLVFEGTKSDIGGKTFPGRWSDPNECDRPSYIFCERLNEDNLSRLFAAGTDVVQVTAATMTAIISCAHMLVDETGAPPSINFSLRLRLAGQIRTMKNTKQSLPSIKSQGMN